MPTLEMPVCEHIVPVKFHCEKCNSPEANVWKLLERIEKLEDSCFSDMKNELICFKKQRNELLERISNLEKHKNYQIDENRKISRRVDSLESSLHTFDDIYKSINRSLDILRFTDQTAKQPYKCPVCDGKGKNKNKLVAEPYDQEIKVLVNPDCHACKGNGIVWD